MIKSIKLVVVTLLLFSLFACSSHTHVIGNGPSSGTTVSARQYYALWGLIPLGIGGGADTNAMAGDAENYAIETKAAFMDYLISGLANAIIPTTISSRTVTVTK
tara:strand:+ start:915 stop:1226 length:312 start_codon:yes stop_codon:yes gene_type:complete